LNRSSNGVLVLIPILVVAGESARGVSILSSGDAEEPPLEEALEAVGIAREVAAAVEVRFAATD
jgi:hypothetical protein